MLVAFLWGGTFLVVRLAMDVSGPFFFVGLRFLCAAAAIAFLFRSSLRGMDVHEVVAGTAIGVGIFVGYGLQCYGLQTIASSKSAFISALYMPLVPLLQWGLMRLKPHLMSWLGIVLAFVGLILLAGPEMTDAGLSFGFGEMITAIGTLGIAVEVVLISFFAKAVDIRRVTVVQLLTASLLGFACMPVFGERVPAMSGYLIASACALGIMSAFIQLAMNWAQRHVSPTRATLIYAGEPVWAGILGRVAGERLPGLAILGGVLVLAGVLVSELRPRRHQPVSCSRLSQASSRRSASLPHSQPGSSPPAGRCRAESRYP